MSPAIGRGGHGGRGVDAGEALESRGVDLVVLDRDIDTPTALGRIFFQVSEPST